MRSVMSIVDRLDIRRAQVLVEAILVEMSDDKSDDLGVNWAVGNDATATAPCRSASFNPTVGSASIGEHRRGMLRSRQHRPTSAADAA